MPILWWAAGVVLDFAAHPALIVRVRPAMVGKLDGVLINVRKNKQKFAARIKLADSCQKEWNQLAAVARRASHSSESFNTTL